ncbi:MAG TPA: hypothetical protein VM864_03230 [Pyrinomonadaceae bacterium]|jgi:hypothetical protein|nr:hypothetical protein [Pyrinomonadaceae bacterium]
MSTKLRTNAEAADRSGALENIPRQAAGRPPKAKAKGTKTGKTSPPPPPGMQTAKNVILKSEAKKRAAKR